MTAGPPADHIAPPETPDEQEAPQPPARRLWVWFLGAVGAGFATLITAGISGAWPWTVDTVSDLGGSPPIHVVADSSIWPDDILAFNDKLSSGSDYGLLTSGPSDVELNQLFLRHPPFKLRVMTVSVTIGGRRSKSVRILDVRPHILSSIQRPSGTCLVFPPPEGEALQQVVEADLDNLRPPKGRSQFLEKIVDLKQDERLTVNLVVGAQEAAYEWDVEVLYDYGSGSALQRTYAAQSNGQPFRVSGPVKKYGIAFETPNRIDRMFRKISRKASCD
ncbi:hypothetical protein SAMN05216276_1010146 [Streptosporangium subroseum]|uniref:Uncharacterized protein n=1 Tax=Streptosporangium subroseum TaxID=106412 RepID=A0A239EZ45_9ACTN|nr:hypothetical protein [Streptosporangium subroseum]SNS50020.1 hypothetical protein SAMN05216276_1010146 [Streptosporangium subroseum]